MKNSQKGSAIVILCLVVIVLLVIGFATYVYLQKNQVADKKVACNYVYQETEFFLATTTNYLLIDNGTAPDPRGLTFFDLNKCEKVFSTRYSKPIDISNDSVTYWEPISTKPNNINCPNLATWKSSGLGAAIESHVTIDLKDLSKKDLNQFLCAPTQ